MRCVRCKRALRNAPVDGMGPTCYAKAGKPAISAERDLFGHDIPDAAKAATERVRVCIEMATVDAKMAIRYEAAAARRRCGVAA